MTTKNFRLAVVVAMTGTFAVPATALATNGYFAHGYGTANKALGGAGVALPQSAMQAATNPAGMAYVGERFDMSLDVFNAERGYRAQSTTANFSQEQASEDNWFFVPALAYNYMLTPQDSIGMAMYGNGLGTRYERPVFGNFSRNKRTGVFFAQLQMAFNYAHKFSDGFSVGLAPIFVYQRIKIEGLEGFAPASTTISNNGADNAYGGGFRLGTQFDVGGGLTLGASYQTRLYTSKFHKYANTFADSGEFDVPPTFVVGLSWAITKSFTMVFDFQHIAYADIDSIGNPEYRFLTKGLGGPDSAGFSWDDVKAYKIGFQYETPNWIWRLGYNRGDAPMEGGYDLTRSGVLFNIIAPGVTTDHLTAGFTRELADNQELSFAYMHGFKNVVEGSNFLFPGITELYMRQNSYELAYSKKW